MLQPMSFTVDHFISRAKRFMAARKYTPVTLSQYIFNDSRTLPDLMLGKYECSLRKLMAAEKRLDELETKAMERSQ